MPAAWPGWAERIYRAEAPRAALWLPVAFGLGIWAYFSLSEEPSPLWALAPAGPATLLLLGWPRRAGVLAEAVALGALVAGLGFAAALLHARAAAAPVLNEMVEETLDGRVRALAVSASGAPRLTLDRVRIYGLTEAETPARVRVSLVGQEMAAAPRPGERVRVYARLFPPGGPVEPGAFDFRRAAWFAGIGGVGYALGPPLALGRETAADGARLWLAERRAALADALRARLPAAEGAFAAAVIVGDRSGIDAADIDALRAANLAHLLAISGLHMGILCGLLFALTRLGVAAVPALGLRVNGKKLAAGVALLGGAGYLALSGATVPTQRAYAMVAVALVAVLADRPAITLRALGVAALIVLALRPVSLFDPGFQMSFAATAGLVAVFEAWPRRRAPPPSGIAARGVRLVAIYFGALVLSSVVAGLATAPYAAAHFNRVPLYGLPANLVAVPVMGLWIAPMAVLAGALAPLGLAGPALAAMGAGIGLVLEIATVVASWEGAVMPMPAGGGAALGLVTLGGLWMVLLASPLRLAGALPLAIGIWALSDPPPRPPILLAPGARLVGVMGPEGRVVDHPRAQSFAAESWLRRDGDGADQEAASRRPGAARGRGWVRAELAGGWRLEVVHARRPEPARLAELCAPRVLLVARHGGPLAGPCCYLGEAELARLGAVAAFPNVGGPPRIEGAARRRRLWSPPGAGPVSTCG